MNDSKSLNEKTRELLISIGAKPNAKTITSWQKFKLFAYQHSLTCDKALVDFHIEKLRAKAAKLEAVADDLDAKRMTEEEGERIMNELKQQADAELSAAESHAIGKELIKRTSANIGEQVSFVEQVQDAKLALELAVSTFRKETIDFLDEMSKHLVAIRQTRMAIGIETKQLLSQCDDVRQFFLSPEHEVETARLKEFVDLCERLKLLKESGFLDTVADTILKLESK